MQASLLGVKAAISDVKSGTAPPAPVAVSIRHLCRGFYTPGI
jgi:hypothetical protein